VSISVAEKQQIGRFCAGNTLFSCLARVISAESQQLPETREVKVGARGITDLMLF
jgi:hypothetical protein